MGHLWKSADMIRVSITMQREAAHDTVAVLGEHGIVEFVDLADNVAPLQRHYINEIRRCEELERKIRYFEKQIKQTEGVKVVASGAEEDRPNSLDQYETDFDSYEKELRMLGGSLEQMMTKRNKEEELLHVINQGEGFFKLSEQETESSSEVSNSSGAASDSGLIEGEGSRTGGGLGYLTGVINRDKEMTFNLLSYRATRGNVIPRYSEIKELLYDQKLGKKVEKNVFIVFFSGQKARDKIKKICESLGASVHDYPESDVAGARKTCESKIRELDTTIESTVARIKDILSDISVSIQSWKRIICKEKAIFHTMNKFDYSIQNSVIAQGWIPKQHKETVENILQEATSSSQAQVPSYMEELDFGKAEPPTYFETNQFTQCFQDIVNAYGVPKYKEVNPAPASIVTFPFLFAVMFGDYGHGVILTMFALTLLIGSKPIGKIAAQSELIGMIFHGRWIMLLMGIFSIFTGLLYNDCFALSFDIFGTGYKFHDNIGVKEHGTYVFGVDPAWYGTLNKLAYYNSVKMKMAIIFGVTQMMVGIFFSLWNHITFKHYEDIFFEFIPEVIILGLTFGYMSFMIIYKWCRDFSCTGCGTPPSLLNTMTDFFLHPWGVQEAELYPGQPAVQIICLVLVGISVPVLLIPKPIYELIHHRRSHSKHLHLEEDGEHQEVHLAEHSETNLPEADSSLALRTQEISLDVEKSPAPAKVQVPAPAKPEGEEEEPFSFSDAFIKQMIHTIEFALGSVSNTASYLRLWALSLAHSQLSEVFWSMTINLVLTLEINPTVTIIMSTSGIGIFIAFLFWFGLTIGVLLCMESLSAFLHALRLHWVEFQNKFYKGEGHLFDPFSIKTVLAEMEKPQDE